MRRPFLTACLLLLCAVLGIAGGYLYAWWFVLPDVSPVEERQVGEGRAAAPASLEGWCCFKGAPQCRKVEKPVDCFRAGGMAMNVNESNCNNYCSKVNQ